MLTSFSTEINPYLSSDDFLYHLGFDRKGNGLTGNYTGKSLEEVFGDTSHVCMGGSSERAERFANTLHQELYPNSERPFVEAIGKTERFSLFKVGGVISVSHGMGMPSMSILLHEIAKVVYYAKGQDANRLRSEVKFIRIGTSGGIGVNAGDVIVTQSAVNPKGEKNHTEIILGEEKIFPTHLDSALVLSIVAANREEAIRDKVNIILGDTIGTNCFYEGQARLDGFFAPGYSEEEKQVFLQKLYDNGVRNFEMESGYFASFCLRAGISGAIVCVALLNRLKGDQVLGDLTTISQNAEKVVLNYLRKVKAM